MEIGSPHDRRNGYRRRADWRTSRAKYSNYFSSGKRNPLWVLVESVASAEGHVLKARSTSAKALVEYEKATRRNHVELPEIVKGDIRWT